MDPGTGRFASRDPSGGSNLYPYADNAPGAFVDRSGRSPQRTTFHNEVDWGSATVITDINTTWTTEFEYGPWEFAGVSYGALDCDWWVDFTMSRHVRRDQFFTEVLIVTMIPNQGYLARVQKEMMREITGHQIFGDLDASSSALAEKGVKDAAAAIGGEAAQKWAGLPYHDPATGLFARAPKNYSFVQKGIKVGGRIAAVAGLGVLAADVAGAIEDKVLAGIVRDNEDLLRQLGSSTSLTTITEWTETSEWDEYQVLRLGGRLPGCGSIGPCLSAFEFDGPLGRSQSGRRKWR
jgi:hypothetical protein